MHIYKTVYIVYIVYIQKVIGDVDENNFKNNSDFPIYEQIKQQVKQNILKGYVAPGAFAVNERTCQRSSSKFDYYQTCL